MQNKSYEISRREFRNLCEAVELSLLTGMCVYYKESVYIVLFSVYKLK